MSLFGSLIQINIGAFDKDEKMEEKSKVYNTIYGPMYIEDVNALSDRELQHYFGPFETGGY